MMKKTEQIAFRTEPETYKMIEDFAKKKKWSIAFTVNEICKEYFEKAALRPLPAAEN